MNLFDIKPSTWRKVKNDAYRQGEKDGEAKGKTEGKAEGLATAILKVLAKRGLRVSKRAREQILKCTDTDRLQFWLDRAFDVSSVTQLFSE